MSISWSFSTPKVRTPRMLLASTQSLLVVALRTRISHSKRAASRTKTAAGLACRPTSFITRRWSSCMRAPLDAVLNVGDARYSRRRSSSRKATTARPAPDSRRVRRRAGTGPRPATRPARSGPELNAHRGQNRNGFRREAVDLGKQLGKQDEGGGGAQSVKGNERLVQVSADRQAAVLTEQEGVVALDQIPDCEGIFLRAGGCVGRGGYLSQSEQHLGKDVPRERPAGDGERRGGRGMGVDYGAHLGP